MARIDKKQKFVIKHIQEVDTQLCYHVWHPATDIFETKDEIRVKLEIGGMKNEDFSINFYKNCLSITGFRSGDNKEGSYHRMEIPFGEFSSSINIPCEIKINSIEASYENGFLTIVLPKVKSIRVEISED